MKTRDLLAFLKENVQTIGVQFKDCEGNGFGTVYTYKTTDMDIEVGDTVVVDAVSTGMTTVVVAEVHGMLDLDLEAKFDYKWIVGKVDVAGYSEFLANEDDAVLELAKLQQKAERKDALDYIRERLGLTSKSSKALDKLVRKINAM